LHPGILFDPGAALDRRLAMQKREGSKRARDRLGLVGVSTLRADLPLEIVQIDHTLVDVSVVDREHRLSIGRPWLTLAIDIATRAVVGFSVSFENPSVLSVITRALARGSIQRIRGSLSRCTLLVDRDRLILKAFPRFNYIIHLP
jgi:transposase InsO family protein